MDYVTRRQIETEMEQWLLKKFSKAEILELLAKRSAWCSQFVSVHNVTQWLLEKDQEIMAAADAARAADAEKRTAAAQQADHWARQTNASTNPKEKLAFFQKHEKARKELLLLLEKSSKDHAAWEQRHRFMEKLQKDAEKQQALLERKYLK